MCIFYPTAKNPHPINGFKMQEKLLHMGFIYLSEFGLFNMF